MADLYRPVAKAGACALGRLGRAEARLMLVALLKKAPSEEVIEAVLGELAHVELAAEGVTEEPRERVRDDTLKALSPSQVRSIMRGNSGRLSSAAKTPASFLRRDHRHRSVRRCNVKPETRGLPNTRARMRVVGAVTALRLLHNSLTCLRCTPIASAKASCVRPIGRMHSSHGLRCRTERNRTL
jgi:hypothetical protein